MAKNVARKSIVWLASYPKSGNTWIRLFLLNYLADRPDPFPINEAQRLGTSDANFALYRQISQDASLTPADHVKILKLRPAVLERQASGGADVNFLKTHFHNGSAGGQRLIPPHLTRGAIYIVRNPLDILPSYADHYAITVEQAARQIADRENAALPDKSMTAQFLGAWSHHVRSWTAERRFPVCTVRYEDLHAQPRETFGKILEFLHIPADDARRDRAIDASSFRELRRQEDENGFIEKSDNGTRFFREGRTGGWRESLSPELIAKVRADHAGMMEKFGYAA